MNREDTIARARKLSQSGWPLSYPVAQFPNPPLAIAFAALAAERLTDGRAQEWASAVASLGLGVWAYLELVEGDNGFRRVLGAAGIALVLARMT